MSAVAEAKVVITGSDHTGAAFASVARKVEQLGKTTKEVGERHRNGASCFRVQGSTVFVEFAPQWPGGDLTQHVHTIYRDMTDGHRWASVPGLDGRSRRV